MWEPLRINSRPEPRTQMLRARDSALLALFTGGQLPLKNTEGMELGGQMVEVMGTKGPEGLCATGFCKLPEGDWSDVSSFFFSSAGWILWVLSFSSHMLQNPCVRRSGKARIAVKFNKHQ